MAAPKGTRPPTANGGSWEAQLAQCGEHQSGRITPGQFNNAAVFRWLIDQLDDGGQTGIDLAPIRARRPFLALGVAPLLHSVQ
jgi:hypothetical protein